MTQAFYTSLSSIRTIHARKWELCGVLTLLASCAAYGVFVLGQVA